MIISMIVAMGKNRVIGNNNQLLWHLSDDLKNFKRITLNHHILMGRKTFDSIGKPLPKRTSIILSRNKDLTVEGAHCFSSIDEAIDFAKENGEEELVVCGGAEIYKLMLSKINKLYLTTVDCEMDGDAFFPEVDLSNWVIKEEITQNKNEKNEFKWLFRSYIKNGTT